LVGIMTNFMDLSSVKLGLPKQSVVIGRFQNLNYDDSGGGAEPHDSYNHADSSWKIPGNTTTVI